MLFKLILQFLKKLHLETQQPLTDDPLSANNPECYRRLGNGWKNHHPRLAPSSSNLLKPHQRHQKSQCFVLFPSFFGRHKSLPRGEKEGRPNRADRPNRRFACVRPRAHLPLRESRQLHFHPLHSSFRKLFLLRDLFVTPRGREGQGRPRRNLCAPVLPRSLHEKALRAPRSFLCRLDYTELRLIPDYEQRIMIHLSDSRTIDSLARGLLSLSLEKHRQEK